VKHKQYNTVYKITHIKSGKEYIGVHQTYNLDDGYMGSGKYIKSAIAKYGIEAFTKEILHVFDNEEDMDAKERELVTEEYCDRLDTYNIAPGGFGGGFRYINRNPHLRNGFENRDKDELVSMSRITGMRGQIALQEKFKNDPDSRKTLYKKISESMKGKQNWLGKKHTETTKNKIGKANSVAQSGSKNSQHGTMWITDGIQNRKIKKVDSIPDEWYKGRTMK